MGNVILPLSKPIECTTSRENPNVNHGLCVMMCQCRFTGCNECITLVGDVGCGGGSAFRGQRVYRESLYLLFSFAVNLKHSKNSLLI